MDTSTRSRTKLRLGLGAVVALASVLTLAFGLNSLTEVSADAGLEPSSDASAGADSGTIDSTDADTTDGIASWYPAEVQEMIVLGRGLSADECEADGVICDEQAFAELMEIFRPRPSGQITDSDAVGRALLNAVDPDKALEAPVSVARIPWSEAARMAGLETDYDIRLGTNTPVLVVTVYADFVQTEGPAGYEGEVVSSYSVFYSQDSAHGFLQCWGCAVIPAAGKASDFTSTLPAKNLDSS